MILKCLRFLMMISMLLATPVARAFDFSVATAAGQTVYYTVTSASTVKVVSPDWNSHTKPTGLLVLPPAVSHEGTTYSVTEVDNNAFQRCTGLTGVVVPEGVTRIGTLAFAFCTALDSVSLPSTLTQIGMQAFNSTALVRDSAHWSAAGLLAVDGYVIAAQAALTGNIVVPEGTVGIANAAFYYCIHFDKVCLPASLRFVGGLAFSECNELDTVAMASEVPPALGDDSFLGTTDFVVSVPCGSLAAYNAAAQWNALALHEDCGDDPGPEPGPEPGPWPNPFPHPWVPIHPDYPVAIDSADMAPALVVTAVEGGIGIQSDVPCMVMDMAGRRVAAVQPGYAVVELPAHGVYVVCRKAVGRDKGVGDKGIKVCW